MAEDNPDAAIDTVNEIYEKAQILKQFPRSGHQYEESNKNIRILLYGHYRIAYWIKSDEQIDILGVFHGAMEIDQYLD
ncbi:MAG: type II toxin-antitoxin system RelE/ParE family toxin [bacterium]